MGHLEQFAKRVFAEETAAVSHGAMEWEMPPEMPLVEVRPDGLLRVRDPERAALLPWPWRASAGRQEVLIELKMQRDHLDFAMVQRARLRRQSRQVLLQDATPRGWVPEVALWIVSPHLPAWLEERLGVERQGPGVYGIGAPGYDLLWVVANELPLREELIPFLVARSGQALGEFAGWVARRRPAAWVQRMLEVVPMTPAQRAEVLRDLPPTDDPELLERRRSLIRSWLTLVTPEVKQEVLDEGKKLGLDEGKKLGLDEGKKLGLELGLDEGQRQELERLFERKLRRPLTEPEHARFAARLAAEGRDAVEELLLEQNSEALEAWLVTG